MRPGGRLQRGIRHGNPAHREAARKVTAQCLCQPSTGACSPVCRPVLGKLPPKTGPDDYG